MAEGPEFSRNGLKPGMVVKDKAGIRKVVTQIEGDTVHWQYVDKSFERFGVAREHSTPYARFADTHYITPDTAPVPKAA